MRLKAALVMACFLLLSAGCSVSSSQPAPDFNARYAAIANPYSFDFAAWELNTLGGDIRREISAALPESDIGSNAVIGYFADVSDLNSLQYSSKLAAMKNGQSALRASPDSQALQDRIEAAKPAVERTIQRQLSQVLSDEGIYNPFGYNRLKLTFPAVKFKLEKPLNVLIVSPRDRIDRIRETVIRPDMTDASIEQIESSLAGLNVSAIIVPIGGLAVTYPSFVIDNADLRFTLNAAAEEWLHQYLAFKPLGFAYVLDLLNISVKTDIPILNETVAGVAAEELGGRVYDRYYARSQDLTSPDTGGETSASPVFDFNAAMRTIRLEVDSYLSQGRIEEAEEYMRSRQQYLADNGYYLRKLNQAYFAFYGSYAYSATSVDPIGQQVKSLRQDSGSLKQFLEDASGLRSRQDLAKELGQTGR
jgi:hypothetical protein